MSNTEKYLRQLLVDHINAMKLEWASGPVAYSQDSLGEHFVSEDIEFRIEYPRNGGAVEETLVRPVKKQKIRSPELVGSDWNP